MLAYLKALRAPFLSGSLMPVFLTGAWAYTQDAFALTPFLLCLLGVGSLHVAANLINDWADSTGSDPINMRLTPFSGGSRVIQSGDLTRKQVLNLSLFFLRPGRGRGLLSDLWPSLGAGYRSPGLSDRFPLFHRAFFP